MAIHYSVSRTSAATLSVPAGTSIRAYVATASSGTQTFTLPKASLGGQVFSFICGDAGGEILINPLSSDGISMKASEGGASLAPAAGTGVRNTAANNVVDDRVTLLSDGVSTWYAIEQSGTWASQ